jgi:lantibiotic modifying enzyme
LRLGEATGETRFIDGATARAAWLEEVSIREGISRIWPWQTDHEEFSKWRGLSFVPGAAGIGYVLACLYERTKEERWATLVREAAVTLRREGREEKGGLNWPDTLGGFEKGEERKCQWCYGASGDGLFLTKAFAVLGDLELGRLARAAGEATYGFGDVRRNPCLCHGLAGNASLFLDLHAATGEAVWLERAAEFARLVMGYRETTPEGDVWQSDDPGCHSPDFLYGVSGTGHFLLRLWRPDVVERVPIL